MKKWILNYLGSPVKVIGTITYLFLMWGIWLMVEIGNVFVANIFLGFTCLLLYSGYDALESKKNKDG
jgi:hypothetical protein